MDVPNGYGRNSGLGSGTGNFDCGNHAFGGGCHSGSNAFRGGSNVFGGGSHQFGTGPNTFGGGDNGFGGGSTGFVGGNNGFGDGSTGFVGGNNNFRGGFTGFGGGNNGFVGGNNGFGGGNNGFGGGNNGFGGGNNCFGQNYDQLRSHHQPGATRTVNHGANVFNLYFENSGRYDFSFNGVGLGVGTSGGSASTRASQQQEQPQPETCTHSTTTGNTGMFAPNSFSTTSGACAKPSLLAICNTTGGAPRVTALPQPTVPQAAFSAFRPIQPSTSAGGQQYFPHANVPNTHVPNSYAAVYSHYRVEQPLSQSSLEDDMFEEDDRDELCGCQCSLHHGHRHYNGYQ